MRAFFAVVLLCLLGIALGYGIAVERLRRAPWNSAHDEAGWDDSARNRSSNEPAPKVVVEQPEYDLGKIDLETTHPQIPKLRIRV
jgi:hypothetical protein